MCYHIIFTMESSLSLVCVTWCFCFPRIRNSWDFNFSKYVWCLLLSAAGDSIKTISWCAPRLYSHNRERGGEKKWSWVMQERWLRATGAPSWWQFLSRCCGSRLLMETSTRYTLHYLHSYTLPQDCCSTTSMHPLWNQITFIISFRFQQYVYFTYLRFDLCGQMMNDNWQETSWYFNWIVTIHWSSSRCCRSGW